MANPTTNYGFVLPTPTDLVTDLPADFDVALQGVDSRLKALQPGTTSGDLAYSSATANTNVRLPIGTSGQVLAVSGGGVPAWTTTSDVTPLTTKGDLFTFTTVDARLGVGANGTVLQADSAEATGLKWATPAAAGKSFALLNAGGTALTGAQTITVSGISGIEDFLIIFSGASSASAQSEFSVRFNTDTGNNYASFGIRNAAPATYSPTLFSAELGNVENRIRLAQMTTNAASVCAGFLMVTGGTTTGRKALHGAGACDSGTNGSIQQTIGGFYSASAAITSVSLFSETGNFDAGTLFIYGSA